MRGEGFLDEDALADMADGRGGDAGNEADENSRCELLHIRIPLVMEKVRRQEAQLPNLTKGIYV